MKTGYKKVKTHTIYGKENIEEGALDQFYEALDQPHTVKAALMPDAHQGYTLPIGCAIATEGYIFPSYVGYDIGCGMSAMKFDWSAWGLIHSQNLYDRIKQRIPVGFKYNDRDQQIRPLLEEMPATDELKSRFLDNGLRQAGTLGGGNHFIELGYDEDDYLWVVIHSGSRGLGHKTAGRYMRMASPDGKCREGHYGLDVTSKEGMDYIKDMNFCLEFAYENRFVMMKKIRSILGDPPVLTTINRHHNHAELVDGLWIHRKGATHADEGLMGVIPGNMRDGSFVVRGKGNSDSLSSSSHGAGRVLGRKKAKKTLDIKEFSDTMDGIIANVSEDTLDESPMAYKDIFEVMELQKDLVDVVTHIKPILNVKG